MPEVVIFLVGILVGFLFLLFFYMFLADSKTNKKIDNTFVELRAVNKDFTDALAHEALARQRKRAQEQGFYPLDTLSEER